MAMSVCESMLPQNLAITTRNGADYGCLLLVCTIEQICETISIEVRGRQEPIAQKVEVRFWLRFHSDQI